VIGMRALTCRRHRAALVAFADRREDGQTIRAALAHLDRCRACEEELASIALTITAVRRAFEESRDAVPRPDAWPRLRHRVTRPSGVGRWAAPWGAVASAALVVAFAAPIAMHPPQYPALDGLGVEPTTVGLSELVDRADQAAERRFIRAIPRGPSPVTTQVVAAPRRVYPDNWRPPARSQTPPPKVD
jgi:anti-sigma factor RsiW